MRIGDLFYFAQSADRVRKGESTWFREIAFYYLCIPAFLVGVAAFMYIGIWSWVSMLGGVAAVILLFALLCIPQAIRNAIRRAKARTPEERDQLKQANIQRKRTAEARKKTPEYAQFKLRLLLIFLIIFLCIWPLVGTSLFLAVMPYGLIPMVGIFVGLCILAHKIRKKIKLFRAAPEQGEATEPIAEVIEPRIIPPERHVRTSKEPKPLKPPKPSKQPRPPKAKKVRQPLPKHSLGLIIWGVVLLPLLIFVNIIAGLGAEAYSGLVCFLLCLVILALCITMIVLGARKIRHARRESQEVQTNKSEI